MRKSLLVFLAFLFLTSTANAQYFGRNKVQWERFNFKILKTEHFDIYYYDREADVVNDVARMAERWYARFSRVFNHSFTHKPIVVYANAADFQQTTTTPELIGQGTGGFTDPFMNRVVLPLTGDYAENDHVLGHELVHVFQFDIAASLTNNRRRFNLEALPLWLVEGMAEYFSKGRIDPLTAMWIRDATIHNRMPDLRKLTRDPYYFPYRYGQALLAYIGGRFGDDAVVRLFLAAGSSGPEAAFERAVGIPAKQIFSDWAESARDLYNPVVEDRPFTLGQPLIGSKRGIRGYLNVGPAYSPDGKYLAFLSTRDIFDIDLFLADGHTGQVIRRLASASRNAHFEALRFIDSAGAWSPDSKKLAFVVFEKGDNYIGIVDVDTGRIEDIRVPGVDAIDNVAWSPDGHTIAIAGQETGVSDLFLFDLNTRQVRRLTNDRYADLQPQFSPDGRSLVFASDRGAGSDLELLFFPGMSIDTIDIDSGRIRALPLFNNVKNFDPHYDADGSSIYFISNAEGVPDIYRYYFSDNHIARVTHVQTGVSGITDISPALTVAQRTGDVAFSMFEDDDYNIYHLPPAAPGVTVTTALAPEAARAAQLPPLRGTGSAITAYLEQPAAGLLPANTPFQTVPVSNALHLAYLGPPTIGVGVGSFGTGVAGSVAAYFSDVLGENNVGFSLEGGGTSGIGTFADQIVGEVFYLNQTHRWNWGADYTHLPFVSALTGVGFDPNTGNSVIQQQRDISRYDDVSGIVQYPFSTTRRVEFSAGFQRQSLKSEIETLTLDRNGNVIDDTVTRLPGAFSVNLLRASSAFVGDSAIFGFLSPVSGTRYRYEIDQIGGDLRFTTALADYRKYFFARPVTFAFRGIHYGRYGRGANDGRLQPIFIGDPSLVHGYEFGSIGLDECVATSNPNACPVFDRLIGTRIAVANAEVRVPLFGTKQFGVFSGFIPTELFFFTDAGAAWSQGDHLKVRFQRNTADRVPVVSSGAGVRLLLSYIPLEFYWAKPFQRPKQGWVFGFNIIPGW